MSKRKLPKTSLEAFRSLDPEKINEIHKRILSGLEVLGSATYEELASYLNLEPQRVWRRLSELQKAQLIYRPGDRKVMKSGRQGFVWKIGNGKDITKKREKAIAGKSVAQYAKDLIRQPTLF